MKNVCSPKVFPESTDVIVGLLFAMFIVLFSIFLQYSWVEEKNKKIQELDSILRFGSEFCDGYLERIYAAQRKIGLELLTQPPPVGPDKALAMLTRYKSLNGDNMGTSLFSDTGDMIADTEARSGKSPFSPLSDAEISELRGKQQTENRLTFEPVSGELPGEGLILPLRYAVHDSTGGFKYLIRSRLGIGLLQHFWATALIPTGSVLGFMLYSGNVINRYSANPGNRLETTFSKAGADALMNYLKTHDFPLSGAVGTELAEAGPNQLIVFRRLPNHQAILFASIPMSSIKQAWWGKVSVPLALASVLLVITTFFWWKIVRQRKTERLSIRKQNELQDVAQGVLVSQEQERARISHELHDEIGQSLTVLKITINRARQHLADHDRTTSLLNTGQKMIEGMMVGVREIAHRLRPAELDQLGLAAALRSHIDKTIRPLFRDVALHENIGTRRFSAGLELCCFRVAQEALTNCLRHSEATQLKVSLSHEDSMLTLAIADNGVGFDVSRYSSSLSPSGSLGLIGMRERVAANGGRFRVLTAPGDGVKILATFDIAGEV